MRLKNKDRKLFQWDKGRIVIVDEIQPGEQVHFSNTENGEAYVLEVNSKNEVQIPDVLLQEDKPIYAYCYIVDKNREGYTTTRRVFQVIKRSKPDDYIYTPEEEKYWQDKLNKFQGEENAGKILVIGEDGYITFAGTEEIADKNFIYKQSAASDTWKIEHNLNKMPSVTIVDSANSQIIGDVHYISSNELIIKFSAPFSGKAFLN